MCNEIKLEYKLNCVGTVSLVASKTGQCGRQLSKRLVLDSYRHYTMLLWHVIYSISHSDILLYLDREHDAADSVTLESY